jgi:hypothetical protein
VIRDEASLAVLTELAAQAAVETKSLGT